jgi:hypothetical protein
MLPPTPDKTDIRPASRELKALLTPAINQWISSTKLERRSDVMSAVTRAMAMLCVEISLSQKAPRENNWQVATIMANGIASLVNDFYKNRYGIDPDLPPSN